MVMDPQVRPRDHLSTRRLRLPMVRPDGLFHGCGEFPMPGKSCTEFDMIFVSQFLFGLQEGASFFKSVSRNSRKLFRCKFKKDEFTHVMQESSHKRIRGIRMAEVPSRDFSHLARQTNAPRRE